MQTKNKFIILVLSLIIISASLMFHGSMVNASSTNGISGGQLTPPAGGAKTNQFVAEDVVANIGDEITPHFSGIETWVAITYQIVSNADNAVKMTGDKLIAISKGMAVAKLIIIVSQTTILEDEFTVTVI